MNVIDPPQDAGQADMDADSPVSVHDAQGILIGDNGRQSNYFTYVGPRGAVSAARHARTDFTGKVESPYQGLFAFGEQDAPFFFGQDAAADEVLSRLRVRAEIPALLVVSGVSGAGKSSLLRAGVLPRIGEITPDGTTWPHLVLTPARSPLSELAAQAAQRTGKDAATLRRTLREEPAGFALTALEAAGTPGDGSVRGRLLLVVDQFEQVFTQCGDEHERRAFIAALHAAATVGHGGRQVPASLVVLVVRADFEARCADYEELVGAVQDRYFLPPMTGRQLRLAITEPARVAGSSVDDALVGELVEAIRAAPSPGSAEAATGGTGVLPHLSHALDQAWRDRAGEGLTLDDYERAGGIEGSIGASADRAYALLTPTQQQAARQVFLRLTSTSTSGTDTGDRASVAELTQGKSPAEIADVKAVLEAFAAQRLLTLAADSVELSHEVLLTAWPLLRDAWLAETHGDRIICTQLRTAAADWDGHGRDPAYLYRGAQLAAVRRGAARWSAAPGRYPAFAGTDRDFLHAANRAANRASIQRRIIAAALALLLVASLTGAVIAINAAETARQQTALAVSGQLAAQSERVDDTDPVTASLLAAAAWRIDSNNPLARESLLNAYAQPERAVLTPDSGTSNVIGSVNGVAFSPVGTILATAGGDGTVLLWNTTTHRQTATITIPGSQDTSWDGVGSVGVLGVAFSPAGTILATAGGDGTVRLWNTTTHRQTATITIPKSPSGNDPEPWLEGPAVLGVAFSPVGTTLAVAPGDGTVRLWDTTTHRQTATITVPGGAKGVAFNPAGTILATADGDRTVRLWNTTTYRQIATIAIPSGGAVNSGPSGVAFSPAGTILATAGSDGTVRLWNTTTYRQIATITIPSRGTGVMGVAFSPDGTSLATAGSDGTARLWDIAICSLTAIPINAPKGVSEVAFSPDSATLATADGDGTVRLWNTTTYRQIATITIPTSQDPTQDSSVSEVAFSPDGEILAIAESDGTVLLWNVATHRHTATITAPSQDSGPAEVAFSPNGKTLAIAENDDATIRLWNTASIRQTNTIAVPGSQDSSDNSGLAEVAFSPDSKTLAITENDSGTVLLWNTRSRQTDTITVPSAQDQDPNEDYGVTELAFSPNSKTLAIADDESGTVLLWNTATHRQTDTITPLGGDVNDMAFSPDGTTLAIADNGGTILLWNVATHRQTITFTVPSSQDPSDDSGPAEVAFSAAGTILVTDDGDGTFRLWDTATGGQVGTTITVPDSSKGVDEVVLSPNGKVLVTVGGDNTARLWDIAFPGNLLNSVCAIAGRSLTRHEWSTDVPSESFQQVCT
jgi:WD40 repeat protein